MKAQFRHVPPFPMKELSCMSNDGALCVVQQQQTIELWKIYKEMPEFCIEIHKKGQMNINKVAISDTGRYIGFCDSEALSIFRYNKKKV